MSRLLLVLAFLLPVSACSSDGPPDIGGPDLKASLAGVVREVVNNGPIAGASVTAGSASATTGQDGRFELQNVPVGSSVTISVTAAGFDSYTQTIAVQTGQNSHDVSLARKVFYDVGNLLVHLPPGISTYRGVIFDMPGQTADSRPLLRGDLEFYQQFPLYGDVAEYRRRLLIFAQEQQFALMGTASFNLDSNVPSTYDAILGALLSTAAESGHPELAHAPLLLYGHSLGGCIAYGFTRLRSARVLAFITGKGGCHTPLDGSGARAVPAYLIIGGGDTPGGAANLTQLFQVNRAVGAPWAVAIEPEAGHTRLGDFDLVFNWMTAVVAARLPAVSTPGQPVQLVPADVTSGWLADRTSFEIARYACYTQDEGLASWLPSELTARNWQALVSSSSVTSVISCGNTRSMP